MVSCLTGFVHIFESRMIIQALLLRFSGMPVWAQVCTSPKSKMVKKALEVILILYT